MRLAVIRIEQEDLASKDFDHVYKEMVGLIANDQVIESEKDDIYKLKQFMQQNDISIESLLLMAGLLKNKSILARYKKDQSSSNN